MEVPRLKTAGGREGRRTRAESRESKTRTAGPPRGPREIIGFIVRLLAGWAIAIVVLALVPDIERWAVAGTVASVGATLRLVSLNPAISGATISLGSAALQIIPECTPVMPVVLLATAMVGYPTPVRWKLAGIAVGIAALWLYNVARMIALVATLAWWPQSFKFVHVYLWQSVTLLVVTALFLIWLRLQPTDRAGS